MNYKGNLSMADNFTNLVNEIAKLRVKPGKLTLGAPAAITPGGANGNKNTQMPLTSSDWRGSVTLYYDRLSLAGASPALGSVLGVSSETVSSMAELPQLACNYFGWAVDNLTVSNPSNVGVPQHGAAISLNFSTTVNRVHLATSMAVTIKSLDPKDYPGPTCKMYVSTDSAIPVASGFVLRNTMTGNVLPSNLLQVLNTPTKYSSTCMYIPGGAGRIEIPKSELGGDIVANGGDFTIESWVYVNNWASGNSSVFAQWGNALAGQNFHVAFNLYDVVVSYGDGVRAIDIITATAKNAYRAWKHWAFQRRGKVLSLYIDGELIGSYTWNFAATGIVFPAAAYLIGNRHADPAGPTYSTASFLMLDDVAFTASAKYVEDFNPTPVGRLAYNKRSPKTYFGAPVAQQSGLNVHRVLTPGFVGNLRAFRALLSTLSLLRKIVFNSETLTLDQVNNNQAVAGSTGTGLVRIASGLGVKSQAYLSYDGTITQGRPAGTYPSTVKLHLSANVSQVAPVFNLVDGDCGETTPDFLIDTSSPKFGDRALGFTTGTTKGIQLRALPNLQLHKGNFTIEAWFMPTAANGRAIIAQGTAYNAMNWGIYLNTNLMVNVGAWSADADKVFGTPSLNTWHHVAMVRSGNTISVYLDGALMGAFTVTRELNSVNPIWVGAVSGGGYFAGQMDEILVYKDYAKYTSAFTPGRTIF